MVLREPDCLELYYQYALPIFSVAPAGDGLKAKPSGTRGLASLTPSCAKIRTAIITDVREE
jgi:hypothetical protein